MVYCFMMLIRPFIITAILLQAALGNICMMQMQMMTPANFSAYEEPHPQECDGYCLADTLVTTTTVVPPALSTVASIVPSPYVAEEQFPRYTAILPTALSPPTAIHISTTVLRL